MLSHGIRFLASLGLAIAFLAFPGAACASRIFGVTGNATVNLNDSALHEINTSTAAPGAEIAQFGAVGSNSIGYNPDDGLVYFLSHISGPPFTFESVDPFSGSPTVNSIGTSGYPFSTSIHDLAYEGGNTFLGIDETGVIHTITTSGVINQLPFGVSGLSGDRVTGLDYVGNTLYAISKGSAVLDIIDRNTGVVTPGPTITLSGESVTEGIDLAYDADSGNLYGLLVLFNQAGRELVTIDTTTGVATSIGDTGQGQLDRFSSMAVVVPEPNSYLLLLIGLGAITLILQRRHRRETIAA